MSENMSSTHESVGKSNELKKQSSWGSAGTTNPTTSIITANKRKLIKLESTLPYKIIVNCKGKQIKRKCMKITRQKLTRFQRTVLRAEYEKCQEWSKDKLERLARCLGLKKKSVYKWNYD